MVADEVLPATRGKPHSIFLAYQAAAAHHDVALAAHATADALNSRTAPMHPAASDWSSASPRAGWWASSGRRR
ncbi:hypothetical protein ACGFY8_34535 [Streptomyces sp. NPDC048232]|uniref:hypothetical protein n=1 Tax=Streptomyces sp. NPDC048232 TaxID=3365520 RepID=UPI00371FCFA5